VRNLSRPTNQVGWSVLVRRLRSTGLPGIPITAHDFLNAIAGRCLYSWLSWRQRPDLAESEVFDCYRARRLRNTAGEKTRVTPCVGPTCV
jgi:hypothetical protein